MKGSGIAVSESAVAEAVVSARGMFGKLVAVKAKPAKPVVLVLPVAALKTSSPAQTEARTCCSVVNVWGG